MSRFLRILVLVLVIVIVAGAVGLAAWDIPAPTKPVEKVIPNDRFPA